MWFEHGLLTADISVVCICTWSTLECISMSVWVLVLVGTSHLSSFGVLLVLTFEIMLFTLYGDSLCSSYSDPCKRTGKVVQINTNSMTTLCSSVPQTTSHLLPPPPYLSETICFCGLVGWLLVTSCRYFVGFMQNHWPVTIIPAFRGIGNELLASCLRLCDGPMEWIGMDCRYWWWWSRWSWIRTQMLVAVCLFVLLCFCYHFIFMAI